ncbi:TATA box-binding protein-associated factor RNA polymerase I subunit B-like [Teleopsis dalmanni]|uniref:TATA box-binding protein-associated factor RNA polymerase I subunit B-like n=1 Tax=Teleopsis dalmanni TaxID=139649 RepID=UPI0018CEABF4|nr:TATA box-binding protein-associated factor RNA polymerase I subunit B-like [Teleopsis dalmanni]XP_037951887.1 TATA box-binding protein-associated factor RNA polymerase I subunit B-like [Teleopsis dalmanni]
MSEELKFDTDPCKICGEIQFTLREGFYYCNECGTKQEQLREVEVDTENPDGVLQRKTKIKKVKANAPELTSWECYNYILRGMVEELLQMGAKEELKTVTLQIWAAYLRRMEVAFFNKKQAELPKLGLRFNKRDAQTLYNYGLNENKRKRKRKDTSSIHSGDSSARDWRKAKRKLDESAYSVSSKETSLYTHSSACTSSTGSTTQAICLKFSARARKQLKQMMPVQHIKKHEQDAEGILKCHTLRPIVRKTHRRDHVLHNMSIRNVYSILTIALNLIEDDIQMADLVRFVGEGHLSGKNIIQFFPDNLRGNIKTILRDIGYYAYPFIYADKVIREHVGLLARFIHISEFKVPNIKQLVCRYVLDLNLPPEVGTYVERLINLLPPQMKVRGSYVYASFEARAMAYIVFVLKLMFGLDGHTEKQISKSAKNINNKLTNLNTLHKSHPKLFVWSEWLEYIEMRKVILSQYNKNFCRQFKQCQSTAQLLEEMNEEQIRQNEQNTLIPQDTQHNVKVAFMQKLFEKFMETCNTAPVEKVELLQFAPCLTPGHSYFKQILLHYSKSPNLTIIIPEFMRIDHTQRSLNTYMSGNSLREFFGFHNMNLKMLSMPCTSHREFAGVYRVASKSGGPAKLHANKVDFDIDENEWHENIEPEPPVVDLEFITELKGYKKLYKRKLAAEALKRQQPSRDLIHISNNVIDTDLLSQHSFDIFDEEDMEPFNNLTLNQPRTVFDKVNIFKDVSDDEEDKCQNTETASMSINQIKEYLSNAADENTMILLKSRMDCWTLMGYMTNIKDTQKKVLETKLPRSFLWLVETCANTIGVDWIMVYEQLLAIELMFTQGIENLKEFQDCIRFKNNNPTKEINMLINAYREIW